MAPNLPGTKPEMTPTWRDHLIDYCVRGGDGHFTMALNEKAGMPIGCDAPQIHINGLRKEFRAALERAFDDYKLPKEYQK